MIVVFTAGQVREDVTQVDNRTPYDIKQSGEAAAELVGGRVGAGRRSPAVDLRPAAGEHAGGGRGRDVADQRRPPSRSKVAAAMEKVSKDPPAKLDRTDWIFAKETVMLDHLVKKQPTVGVEVQAIQVGPVVLLANPSEYFCQFGLDLRAKSTIPADVPRLARERLRRLRPDRKKP